MKMDVASIKNFMLQFGISGPSFGPPGIQQILQKLAFASVGSLQIKEGTYTPANDYHYLATGIPPASAPNFIFIQTPTIVNVTVVASNTQIANCAPVNKIFMLCLPPDSQLKIDSIYLEGRAIHAAQMAQGVPADFFCLMAQAVF